MLRNSQAAQIGPVARRRPKAAREAYSLYVERAAEGANEADGPLSSLSAQMRQDALEPVGQRRHQLEPLSCRRMREGEPGRVKGHAPEALDEVRGHVIGGLRAAPPVGEVPQQRMADRGEMGAALVGAAGLQPA